MCSVERRKAQEEDNCHETNTEPRRGRSYAECNTHKTGQQPIPNKVNKGFLKKAPTSAFVKSTRPSSPNRARSTLPTAHEYESRLSEGLARNSRPLSFHNKCNCKHLHLLAYQDTTSSSALSNTVHDTH